MAVRSLCSVLALLPSAATRRRGALVAAEKRRPHCVDAACDHDAWSWRSARLSSGRLQYAAQLTDSGRADAKRVGAAFRARGVAIERVLTSPWCRCIETANLAFGKSEISTALGNLFTHPENRDRQVREMKQLLDTPKSGNRVLVSHGATILALTGVSLDTAEMLIVSPQPPGGFVVRGRLSVPQ